MKKSRILPFFILFVFGNSLFLLQVVAQQRREKIVEARQQPDSLMPPLIGKDVDAAERELKNINRKLRIEKKKIETVRCAPGKVMDQSPSAQTPLYSATQVVLYYCKKESRSADGIADIVGGVLEGFTRETEVPDVRGLLVREAKQRLKDRILKAKFQPKEDEVDDRRVTEQSEPPGKKIRVNSSVRLTVAQSQPPPGANNRGGRTKEKEPEPRVWVVPDVTGKSVDVAAKIIAKAELSVGAKEEKEASSGWNLVAAQIPLPGTRVNPGAPVNLVIAVQPKTVVVPEVRKLLLKDAKQLLIQSELTPGYVVGTAVNSPLAIVEEQLPLPGTKVQRGSSVRLTVAAPTKPTPSPTPLPTPLLVPNLSGQTQQEAVWSLQRNGFKVGEVTTLPSNSPSGTVIQQQPLAGTPAATGIAINVVLAVPTPTPAPTATPRVFTVPDIRGLTREAAAQSLAGANLRLGQITTQPSNFPRGVVIEQQPLPGTQATAGLAVNTVLAAPTPSPVPTPVSTPSATTTVPDVRGLSRDEANRRLATANLNFGRTTTQPSNFPQGVVIEQQPPPGAEVKTGFAVNVVLATAITPPTPSPPNQPPAMLPEWLTKLIEQIPKVLGVVGLGVFGFWLARLFKRLFKTTPENQSQPPPVTKPKLEYHLRDDQGVQTIDRLNLSFELSLRPKPDAGRQWIEVTGQLIANERSEV